MITVLTEWYIDSSDARQAELAEALHRNCVNPYVERIFVFAVGQALTSVPRHDKITRVHRCERATFEDFFTFAADVAPGKLCAIMNADCHLDETAVLLDGLDMAGRALCLTRWDVRPDGSLRFHNGGGDPGWVRSSGSQDAWIFVSPVRLGASARFFLGIPACDKRIAWILKNEAQLRVDNPSLSLRILHLHATEKRNYDPQKRLPPPYLLVEPTLLT